MKLYQTIGNHDLFGISPNSGIATGDPGYGKNPYEERTGSKSYYSFDHKGYHFFVLDSVHPAEDLGKRAIDDAQLAWLTDDLNRTSASTPIISVTHVPLVTAGGRATSCHTPHWRCTACLCIGRFSLLA